MYIKIILLSVSILLSITLIRLISLLWKHSVQTQAQIFFITGTSGSGKTTLSNKLKNDLSPTKFVIYDFDEIGVPENADALWRQKTTDYWLNQGIKNADQNLSTIICGVAVPHEVSSSKIKPSLPIKFLFLKISDSVITQRLQNRGWHEQLIQDNINWAHYLEKDVIACNGLIIECSRKNTDEVSREIELLLKNNS